jgi:hypothetical protein
MEEINIYDILHEYLSKQKHEVNIIKIHMDTSISIQDLVRVLKFMEKNNELVNKDDFDSIILIK